jgi:hypothetical protein
VETEETGGDPAAWLRVSIAGVDLVRVEAGITWRPLLEAEEEEPE